MNALAALQMFCITGSLSLNNSFDIGVSNTAVSLIIMEYSILVSLAIA
jgi:hypothetical protein